MPQSLVQIYVHAVFSTKDRRPFIQDTDLRQRLYEYVGGLCRNHDCPTITVGGVADHVHFAFRLGKSVAISNLMRDLKRDSSKWIKEVDPTLDEFHWQNGYGAFSVSPSHVDALKTYIANQEEHHRHESFQDEFRRLCRKYGVEIDERFVWD